MKKYFYLAALLLSCSFLSSCAPTQKPLYTWYNSEEVSYQYNKKHTDELQAKLLEEFAKMEAKQKGVRGVVPPGFYAEYGYTMISAGKRQDGIALLKKEIQLYPESSEFVNRILKQLGQ